MPELILSAGGTWEKAGAPGRSDSFPPALEGSLRAACCSTEFSHSAASE